MSFVFLKKYVYYTTEVNEIKIKKQFVYPPKVNMQYTSLEVF